jgi:chromate transporter
VNVYLTLFLEFLRTGLFSVGGGLATLPFLYKIADKYPWFDRTMLVDMIAISESTPGPIGVNVATYAGFRAAGILGGVVATVGLVFPSVIIITLIARFLQKFRDSWQVCSAFYGLRPAVTAMIAAAGIGVFKMALLTGEADHFLGQISWKAVALFAVLYYLTNRFKKHPALYIAAAAVVGVLWGM